jgi:hypothetical protein
MDEQKIELDPTGVLQWSVPQREIRNWSGCLEKNVSTVQQQPEGPVKHVFP